MTDAPHFRPGHATPEHGRRDHAAGVRYWSDPTHVDQLRRLWNAGCTTNAIAREMGINKSQVIGKAHRIGLPGRESPLGRGHPRAGRPTAFAPSEPLPLAPRPPPIPVPLTSPRKCQWPYGDPRKKDFHFCGAPSADGRPYCPEHVASAYRPMSRP